MKTSFLGFKSCGISPQSHDENFMTKEPQWPGLAKSDGTSQDSFDDRLLALHHLSDRLESRDYRVHWKDDVAFDQYLQDLFPIQPDHTRVYKVSALS
jgi:hypothetical protein